LQTVGITHNMHSVNLPYASGNAPIRKDFVSGVCLGNRLNAGGVGGAGEPLLSVKQVAEQLGIATATVYGLCADGRLAHVRVLSVIRIAPSDLAVFIEARRQSIRP